MPLPFIILTFFATSHRRDSGARNSDHSCRSGVMIVLLSDMRYKTMISRVVSCSPQVTRLKRLQLAELARCGSARLVVEVR